MNGKLGENPNIIEISSALKDSMIKAGTYEELTACWQQLVSEFNLGNNFEWGSLMHCLKFANQCFTAPMAGACDSSVKQIFDSGALLAELDSAGIPSEFLLQSVRIGAIKSLERSIQGDRRHDSVQTYADMNLLELNGFNWANDLLKKLATKKTEAKKTERNVAAVQLNVRKEAAIANIQASMHESGFTLTGEQIGLLKNDWGYKLKKWKAFCDRHLTHDSMEPFWTGEYAEQEITPEIFQAFQRACETNSKIQTDSLPFEIINPDSGWFYVLIKNKKTKIRDFLSAAVNNMDSWFSL